MAPAAPMVSVSTGAMNSVLAKLSTLIQNEFKLQKGIRTKVKLLRDELESMKGLLEKLTDAEAQDSLVKGWMRPVREMTYDLEDIIDEFMRLEDKVGSLILTSVLLPRKIKSIRRRHLLVEQLKELELRVREASERRKRYSLDERGSFELRNPVSMEPRPTSIHLDKYCLVGIDGPTEHLIGLLTDGRRQLKVVAIVGMGGAGKTTLARNVYGRLQLQFHCRAFAVVSMQHNIRTILQNIIYAVGEDRPQGFHEASDEKQLIEVLRKILQDRRYLIVLDDLWDTLTWRAIKYALPENCLGSRILITTRSYQVAESCFCHEHDCLFKMRPLNEKESRSLFLRRIFHSESEESYPAQFAEVPNDILNLCGGVPLAIVIIAGLCATTSVATTEVWDTIRKSITPAFGMEKMHHIFNLSYIDLPFQFKTCLLYISMFPKDYVINRNRLVRRWIAEGFISACGVEDVVELGNDYFNELIHRSFLEPVDGQYHGRVDGCRVHDIVLDFIVFKSVEENFVITYGSNDDTFIPRDNIHRLSLHYRGGWGTFTPSCTTTTHVRSLSVIEWNKQMPPLASFPALRVLDVEGNLEKSYLRNIGSLYHLKYLRFRTTGIIVLPEEIGKLKYLETLDLDGAPGSILPRSIVGLKRLMYLLVNNVKLPDGFGRMQSLLELSGVEIESISSLQELGKLCALRVLELNVSGNFSVSSLSKLNFPNLRSLYIQSSLGSSLEFFVDFWLVPCCHLQEFQMMSDYYLPTVPSSMSDFTNLTLLCISIEVVGEEVLQILGALQALGDLKLKVKSTIPKQGLIIRSHQFKRLKQFDFICQNSVDMLMFKQGGMKNLEKLLVVFSGKGDYVANGFRFGIEHLTLLRHLVVEISCSGARAMDVNVAEDAIKNAVSIHPSHPVLELRRLGEHNMVGDERDIIDVHVEEEEKEQNEEEDEVVVERESTAAPES